MPKFTDTIRVHVRAGHGGAGAVSFRREKYIPRGGPDGGDGGKGGCVYLEASTHHTNLSHLFKDRVYAGESGKRGMGQKKHGKDGNDLIIKVPTGTSISDEASGELLFDLVEDGQRCMVAEGGVGGRGNTFFKSSVNQAPRNAQPGKPGEDLYLIFNLRLIADVGLVGLPNAGKSTLLASFTNAKPQIGAYPFTTLVPNLGVVQQDDETLYKIADIPGIIEGAHRGLGLGLSFLMHIERVKVILFLIDVSLDDPVYNLELLRAELNSYSPVLLEKPFAVILTKVDLVDENIVRKKIDLFDATRIIPISAVTQFNIDKLKEMIETLLGELSAT